MALSGNQKTRIAAGGAGRAYAGFTAKAETVAQNGSGPFVSKDKILSWDGLVAAQLGDDRNRREVVYEFSNGRKFYDK